MAKSDGTIIIDTLIDTSGFGKSATNLKSQFGGIASAAKKLGAAIGLAFSVTAVIQFGKESSKTAMQLSDALTGLQSIVEGQGRSFSKAQAFIEEYTKDGLIPATNAITAYKNLAMRGYDDSQIRQVMVALKDASAYGRQASYSMGEAVQSASEGLKNENSILVDNAGVTKNVAKMWEDYAKSIGTTANNLTQQQKIQAEVTGILEESKYQTGDAAKVASTLSGQLQQLSFNFNNLKVAVGNVVNPIVKTLLPVFNAAIMAVTRFANTLASVSAAFFGGTAEAVNSYAVSVETAADAEENLADGISSASKAAKKALAGFDELNVLQSGDASGSSVSGGVSVGEVEVSGDVDDQLTEQVQGTSANIQKIIEKIQELIEPLKNIDLTPAKKAFDVLGSALADFGGIIAEKLEWAWYNILVPLGEWIIEEAAPAAVEALSAAFDFLGSALEILSPLFEALWSLIQPLASFIGDVLIGALNGLTTVFSNLSERLNYTVEDAYKMTDAEKELAESAEKAAEAFEKQKDATEKEEKTISAEMGYYSDLAKEVMALADEKGNVKKADEARVKYILGEFKEAFGTESELVNGVITDYSNLKTEILKTIEAQKARLLLEANEDDFTTALLGKEQAWENLSLAEKRYTAQKEQSEKTIKKLEEDRQEALRMSQIYMENGAWAKAVYAKADAERIANNIAAEKNRVDELKTAYDIADANYKSHLDTIAEYENASQLILEENFTAAIDMLTGKTDAYGAYASSVEEETDRALGALEQEVYDTRIAAEKTKKAFDEGVEGIGEDMVKEMHQRYLDALAAFENAKADAKKAGEGFTDGFVTGLKGLGSGVKNAVQKALSKIGSGSPSGGSAISSITPSVGSAAVPYLAKGAVIPPNAPFMAVLGDQKHGTNVEAPLSTIQEAVAAVMQDYNSANLAGHEATVAVLRDILEAVLGIEIGDDTIAGAVDRYNRKMAVVRGG